MACAHHHELTGGEAGDSRVELAPRVVVSRGVLDISFSRSGGPGGQNVNKVSTRCQLRVALADLPLHEEARVRLAHLAGPYLIAGGVLLIDADEHRSQSRNKDACLAKLRELIVRAQVRPKVRRATRPTRGSVERRLTAKRTTSDKKRRRGDGGGGGDE
jgi:ribosome-associated protein